MCKDNNNTQAPEQDSDKGNEKKKESITRDLTPAFENSEMGVFGSEGAFAQAVRMGNYLSQSTMIPGDYQRNPANCVVAIEMAHRQKTSVFSVMQSMFIIKGRPSWSSQHIIARLNTCGRFEPLEFIYDGQGDDYGCTGVTTSRKTGREIRGVKVTIGMAKGEGWWSKKDRNGNETSKWQTMPELMLQYRAAAFFCRVHAPELILGMLSTEEAIDIASGEEEPHTKPLTARVVGDGRIEQAEEATRSSAQELREKLQAKQKTTEMPEDLTEEEAYELIQESGMEGESSMGGEIPMEEEEPTSGDPLPMFPEEERG